MLETWEECLKCVNPENTDVVIISPKGENFRGPVGSLQLNRIEKRLRIATVWTARYCSVTLGWKKWQNESKDPSDSPSSVMQMDFSVLGATPVSLPDGVIGFSQKSGVMFGFLVPHSVSILNPHESHDDKTL